LSQQRLSTVSKHVFLCPFTKEYLCDRMNQLWVWKTGNYSGIIKGDVSTSGIEIEEGKS